MTIAIEATAAVRRRIIGFVGQRESRADRSSLILIGGAGCVIGLWILFPAKLLARYNSP